MKAIYGALLITTILLLPLQRADADLPMVQYDYKQDFETQDPFQLWTANGTYTVNYRGLSSSKASSGTRSFKLDVTMVTATYLYLKIPVTVPNVGQLQFTGDLFVESSEGTSVALGTNVSFLPAPTSGVNVLERLASPTPNWLTQTCDLVAAGTEKASKVFGNAVSADVGNWTSIIGLFIYSPKGGRIVLYVDNVRVTGLVPEASAYKSFATTAWQNYLARIQSEVNTMADSVLNYTGSATEPGDSLFLQDTRSRAAIIKNAFQARGYPSPDEYVELRSLFRYVSYLGARPTQSIATFPYQPIKNAANSQRILPSSSLPAFAAPGDKISIQACRGEYEPASFLIRAERSVSDIRISVSDLSGPDKRLIPASAIDIKLVKCWYQSGDGTINKTSNRVLLPELLVNNDNLVNVDYVQQKNYLKVTIGGQDKYIGISLPTETIPDDAIIRDADVLVPFALDAERNKQVWVTVHVPEDAASGDYTGTIRVQATGSSSVELTLTVTVLPFDLQPAFLEYAIYYRGKLSTISQTGINSEWKTNDQYLAELQDMKKHGVLYPTIYQDSEMLGSALSLRNKVGLPKDQVYALGIGTGSPSSPSDLDILGARVTSWLSAVSEYGFSKLNVYGIDEASGDRLLSQRPAWQKVREAGARIFVACYEGAADVVGDLLDVPVLSGPYNPNEILKWKNSGKKIFSYGNPQVGIEDPELYRRNYGLGLACADYDGAMNYAYQHSFGHIWNDFDHPIYRDHVFAYPTSSGVVDTIEWEGFREAVDDVRYLTTLIDLTDGQKASVLSWLCPMVTAQANMSDLRAKLIDRILQNGRLSPPNALRVQ